MDKELKQMLDNSKIDKIYSNSLFSLKSISQDLGIWEGFSNTEKMYLENQKAGHIIDKFNMDTKDRDEKIKVYTEYF